MTQEQIQVIREFIKESDCLCQVMEFWPCFTASERREARREALDAYLNARRKLGYTWNVELWQPGNKAGR
jgi:hypothetical protein